MTNKVIVASSYEKFCKQLSAEKANFNKNIIKSIIKASKTLKQNCIGTRFYFFNLQKVEKTILVKIYKKQFKLITQLKNNTKAVAVCQKEITENKLNKLQLIHKNEVVVQKPSVEESSDLIYVAFILLGILILAIILAKVCLFALS